MIEERQNVARPKQKNRLQEPVLDASDSTPKSADIGKWSERLDSNQRPSRPERDALPSCATLRRWRAFYLKGFVSQELSARFFNVPVLWPTHDERQGNQSSLTVRT